MNIYCVRDLKADSFGLPFFAPNEAVALRNLRASMISGDSQLALFPDDFELYFLGTFVDGVIASGDRLFVCSVSALLPKE